MRKFVLAFLLLSPLLLSAQPYIQGFTYMGSYNSHFYYLSDHYSTWTAARDECTLLGGYLTSINSSGENSFVGSNTNLDIWIGFTDQAQEGTWVWTNGDPVTYTNWNGGEPNNGAGGGAQNWAHMYPSAPSYLWDDDWFVSKRFVLEFNTVPLAVELTSFSARNSGSSILLSWRTESETNNALFRLYRSQSETGTFDRIAEFSGSGTTAEPHSYQYIDTRVQNGVTYYYRLSDVDINGIETFYPVTIHAVSQIGNAAVPLTFGIVETYPNPFNPTTGITYVVDRETVVQLSIYNSNGALISTLVNEAKPTGRYTIPFSAQSLPSGNYFACLRAGKEVSVMKLIYIR